MQWISTLSGTIATAAGLVVLMSVMNAAGVPTETAGAGSTDRPASEMNRDQRDVVWSSEETVPVAVDVPGLTPAVSSALEAAGYTELITGQPLDGQLPPTVIQVLTGEDAVLVIESGSDG